METLTPTTPGHHLRIQVPTTLPTEFVDLTERLSDVVAQTGVSLGLINVQSLHTTAAVVVNEHEPLLLGDFAALLEHAAPSDAVYRHDDASVRTENLIPDERVNGHSHCRALLLGPAVTLNIVEGALVLGRWQRVFLVELDGPRERELSVVVLGESGR